MTLRRLLLAISLTLSTLCLAVVAQDTRPSNAPPPATLQVQARLVVLDVAVTDANGLPADGLTAADFRVLEDGQPQTIISVEPPQAHIRPSPPASASNPESFSPENPAAFGQAPSTVLLLDQLNTQFEDSSFARRALAEYLAKQPAQLTQPTALLSLQEHGLRQLSGFTLNRDALQQALAKQPTAYPWTLSVKGKADHGPIDRLDLSLRALESMAQSYLRIPGRKNLIWVGGGFPSLDPATLDSQDADEVKAAFRHITNLMLEARLTLYAIDPGSTAPGMTEIVDADQMAFVMAAGDSLTTGTVDPFDSEEDFDRLGPLTGGRIIRARNDIAAQIADAATAGSHYYTVAYRPTSDSEAHAAFRKIKVQVLRSGLKASTRVGYYARPEDAAWTRSNLAYDLSAAAESPLTWNGLRLAAIHEPGAPPGSLKIDLKVRAGDLSWRPLPDGTSEAHIAVESLQLDGSGNILHRNIETLTANAAKDVNLADPERTADFALVLAPERRTRNFRFVVRDSTSGRISTVVVAR